MNVEVCRLERSEIFRSISWDSRLELWDSIAYRKRVEDNLDRFTGSERAIQLASIETGEFFKSTIVGISFAVDSCHRTRPIDMLLTLVDRSSLKKIELFYRGVEQFSVSGLENMLVDAEILGFELVKIDNLIRHAFVFIEEEHALVIARSVSLSITTL